MKYFAFILMFLAIMAPVMAQEGEPAPEVVDTNDLVVAADTNSVADAADTNSVETAEATNRIEEADALLLGLRDPFWPVGYEPAPPEPELTGEESQQAKIETEIKKKIQWPALQLKGITKAGEDRYMAIIKGVGLVEGGQTVSMRRGDMLYSWLIDKVTAEGVEFTRLEARPYQLPTIGVRTQ
jgi:hypothetical protein